MQSPILSQISQTKPQKAWVVFSGQADIGWLKILKNGFRHCYIVLNDGDHWISIDPLSCHTEIMVHHIAPDFDLPAWLRARNLKVVPAPLNPRTTQAPWMIHSCVEAVKRMLGIHDIRIITPYQLYKKLVKAAYCCPQTYLNSEN